MSTPTADYEKLKSISNQLFGVSPINLDARIARKIAMEIAKQSLEVYRARCRAACIRKGLIRG